MLDRLTSQFQPPSTILGSNKLFFKLFHDQPSLKVHILNHIPILPVRSQLIKYWPVTSLPWLSSTMNLPQYLTISLFLSSFSNHRSRDYLIHSSLWSILLNIQPEFNLYRNPTWMLNNIAFGNRSMLNNFTSRLKSWLLLSNKLVWGLKKFCLLCLNL